MIIALPVVKMQSSTIRSYTHTAAGTYLYYPSCPDFITLLSSQSAFTATIKETVAYT